MMLEYQITGNFGSINGTEFLHTAEESLEKASPWVLTLKPGESVIIRRLSTEEIDEYMQRETQEQDDDNQSS